MAKLKTGRHTSGLKELRKNVKRRKINASKKTYLHTISKKVETAVLEGKLDEAKTYLNEAFSAFDKAAKTNLVHKNKASRAKARLSKKLTTKKD